MKRYALMAVALAVVLSACTGVAVSDDVGNRVEPAEPAVVVTTVPDEIATTGLVLPPSPEVDVVSFDEPMLLTGETFSFPPRVIGRQGWIPFAQIGDVVLHHPSNAVEAIGFHESSHDGAQQMTLLDSAIAPFTMSSRERGNGARTAADIAIDPDEPVRSPVTGTVLRAGSYTLYCQYSDDFAVIEPDARPGWEVKVLHINNVSVRRGDRVQAGVSVIADGPTKLPFRSQVDDATSGPSWPHTHIEVVDPSIPDRPGSGC